MYNCYLALVCVCVCMGEQRVRLIHVGDLVLCWQGQEKGSWEKAMFILIWTQKINVPTDVTLGILHGAQM